MQVFINSVLICKNHEDVLPSMPGTSIFSGEFTPAPLGDTGTLFFKVFFTVLPGDKGGTDFFIKANVPDTDLYLFTEGNQDFQSLQFEVNQSESPVLLEFRLRNLEPLSESIPARLTISTRTENSSQQTISLTGNNG